jgi:crotonobetainyl-CoA:carnitine CoA-transferase CaiB-like acyl-CoA transferase
LELAHLVAGPVCGMFLAEMGADVIKVEQPGQGDVARTLYDPRPGGDSVVFLTVNRNKRSLALDLSRPEGVAAFRRLAAGADVVIEAYRGGVAERLGVDYAQLAPLNARLIYCSLSAFGPTGPWREKPGLDMLAQALGGLLAITGEREGGPVLCGAPVVDTMGALMAGQAVLTALLHRERTGQGQRVDVSLLNATLLAHAARLSVFLATGEDQGRHGSAHPYLVPFQAFRASDGWIYVAVWVDRLWSPFCSVIGRRDLVADPRFASNRERLVHRDALIALLEPIFRERTVKEWMVALEGESILCSPVNRYSDLLDDPQVRASGMIVEETHPRAGRFRTLAPPTLFSATPGAIRTPAPALGEHSDAVLVEAGLAPTEVARLRTLGVVA